jgi:hypothetical protein
MMRGGGMRCQFGGAGFFDAPDFYKSNAMNFQALIQEDELIALYKETADERR